MGNINKEPEITWYIEENNTFIPEDEYYAGTLTNSNDLIINIKIWNNRFNQEDVADLLDPKLTLSFDKEDSSYLFKYCYVKIDEGDFKKINYNDNFGEIKLNRTLTGFKNNGEEQLNNSNFCSIVLKFLHVKNIQEGLKNLYINIEES